MGNKHGKLVEKQVFLEQNIQLNRDIDDLKSYQLKKKSNNYHEFKPNTFHHLIVDDAAYNKQILAKYLEKLDITCDEASNGKEALTYNLDKYDIIWMDIRMPIMDGLDCTIALRERGYKGIIIGVTGDVSPDNIKKCHNIGMNQVILKPIIYNEFMNSHYVKMLRSKNS